MWISELECPTQSCYILNGGFYIPGGKFRLRIKEIHNVRNILTLGFKIKFNGLCTWKWDIYKTLKATTRLKERAFTSLKSVFSMMIIFLLILHDAFSTRHVQVFKMSQPESLFPTQPSSLIPSQSGLTIICPKAGIGEWRSGATTVGLDSWSSLIGTRWEGSQKNKELEEY